jgi:hypothetical protein
MRRSKALLIVTMPFPEEGRKCVARAEQRGTSDHASRLQQASLRVRRCAASEPHPGTTAKSPAEQAEVAEA